MRGPDQPLRLPWDLMCCGGLVGTGRAAKAHGRTGLVRGALASNPVAAPKPPAAGYPFRPARRWLCARRGRRTACWQPLPKGVYS